MGFRCCRCCHAVVPGRAATALLGRLTTGPMATRTSRDSANTSTGIDHLHAASSQTTETLAFVDVADNDDMLELSAEHASPRSRP